LCVQLQQRDAFFRPGDEIERSVESFFCARGAPVHLVDERVEHLNVVQIHSAIVARRTRKWPCGAGFFAWQVCFFDGKKEKQMPPGGHPAREFPLAVLTFGGVETVLMWVLVLNCGVMWAGAQKAFVLLLCVCEVRLERLRREAWKEGAGEKMETTIRTPATALTCLTTLRCFWGVCAIGSRLNCLL